MNAIPSVPHVAGPEASYAGPARSGTLLGDALPAEALPGHSVRLAPMRWWHIERLLPLEAALFGAECWTVGIFWSELGQVDTRHYLVAFDGDEIVGYAGLCDYPDQAWIQTMAVAPAHQRSGLGSRLLVALLAEAERRGQRVVSLEVRADNLSAQRLYARHGFRQIGVRRGYYQPSGVDALVLDRRC